MAGPALLVNLTQVVAISTFASLFYYTMANFSALKIRPGERRYPSIIPALGALSCIAFLIWSLFEAPDAWIVGGISLDHAGIVFYLLKRKYGKRDF